MTSILHPFTSLKFKLIKSFKSCVIVIDLQQLLLIIPDRLIRKLKSPKQKKFDEKRQGDASVTNWRYHVRMCLNVDNFFFFENEAQIMIRLKFLMIDHDNYLLEVGFDIWILETSGTVGKLWKVVLEVDDINFVVIVGTLIVVSRLQFTRLLWIHAVDLESKSKPLGQAGIKCLRPNWQI